MTLDADRLWDAWTAALAERPDRAPEDFAATYGDDPDETLALLYTMVGVVREAPPPPLVDVLASGVHADGRPRFAGFRLEEGLGQGSSGMVFRATDLRADAPARTRDRRLALKVLNPLLAAAPERRAQILREAEIVGRLDHPGIVRVLDRGVERGYAWIATELVEGLGLEQVIEDGAAPAARAARTLELGLELADALAHAHARGIMHRDLKPANVRLDAEGRACILDFGLARAEGTAFAVSSTGEAVGTPLYMAPEQARGEGGFGPWTDLYALGLMLLELGAGRRLVAEPNVLRSLDRIARGELRPPRAMLAELEPRLRAIVERCTERHADDRYPDAKALIEDLEAARRGDPLPWGSLSTAVRWVRCARRHPVRAAAWILGVPAVLWLACWVWWTWCPVDVRIGTQLDGKNISLNGEIVGHTPKTLRLRPGLYEAELQFNDPTPGRGVPPPRYEVTFRVEPRTPLELFWYLDPPRTVPRLFPDPPPEEPFAWVQVATPLETVRLVIDGRTIEDAPGHCCFPLAYGDHTVRIEAEGYRSIERELRIRDPNLRLLCHELDSIDSERRTIVLYCPGDQLVRESLRASDGLRVYFEGSTAYSSSFDHALKTYWGPSMDSEEGFALLCVQLPFAPGDIDVIPETEEVAVNGYSLIEMGPSPDDLVPVISFRGGSLPTDSRVADLGSDLTTEAKRLLLKRMGGSTDLWIRFRVGGVSVGESVSFACILRTNAFPDGRPGKWAPALTIRVRP